MFVSIARSACATLRDICSPTLVFFMISAACWNATRQREIKVRSSQVDVQMRQVRCAGAVSFRHKHHSSIFLYGSLCLVSPNKQVLNRRLSALELASNSMRGKPTQHSPDWRLQGQEPLGECCKTHGMLTAAQQKMIRGGHIVETGKRKERL